jgi:dipeptidyl-peptidase-4
LRKNILEMNVKAITTAFLATVLSTIAFSQDKAIKNSDIWLKGMFRQDYVWGLKSMNDGIHYTTLDRSKDGLHIVKYAYKNGEVVDTLFSTSDLEKDDFLFSGYSFSNDEAQLLLKTEVEQIYRHSTKEYNFIYDLESGELTKLPSDVKQKFATFSPQGDKIAYVAENDLYIYDIESGETTQATEDGEKNKIINGGTDWVYEEEFAFDKAFFWSPDGKYIAYYRFDEEHVREFSMAMYQGNLYPEDYKFKYPKAGERNSNVQIKLYNVKSGDSKKIAETNKPYTEYFPRVKWTKDPNLVAIQSLNRHQNHLKILTVNAKDGDVNIVYEEKNDTYISITDDWTFLKDGKSFIMSSEKSGFNHLYKVSLKDVEAKAITQGNWVVTDFYGIDEESGYLYYRSAEQSPMKRDVYRIKLNGEHKQKISSQDGWNTPSFSEGMKYFINTYSTANSPNYITLNNANGDEIRVLKDSENLKNRLKEYALSNKEFFSFKTEKGHQLNASIIKPIDFDSTKEYPVLISIYGGPGSQTVTDEWGGGNYMWHQMLAQKGYIVISVDNRGTGARGVDFKKSTYKQLGKLELEDYIETVKYLEKQDYVDDERIGIWGWSFGGYMSSLAITKGSKYFDAAIAVAPVTTWKYYDSIYTERYMQTPEENEAGYENNSPINFTSNLQGNYLLVHGTADDNVHFQNTAEMINALVRSDKQFDLYVYPDRNHGIYGGNTRNHLYNKFTNWLEENL